MEEKRESGIDREWNITDIISTTQALYTHSNHITDRRTYQLIADGFLSVHMLPLIATRTRSGNSSSKISIALRHPLET